MPFGCRDMTTRKNLSPASESHCMVTNAQGIRGAWILTQKYKLAQWHESRRAQQRPYPVWTVKAEHGTVLPSGMDTGACTGTSTEASAKQKPRCCICPAVLELGKMFHGKHVRKNADLVTLFPQFAELLF